MPTWNDLFAARAGLLVDGWTADHSYSADLIAIYPQWGTGSAGDVIQFVRPEGFTDIFACETRGVAFTSDSSEPDWASVADVGDTIADNAYTWVNCGPDSGFPDIAVWQPDTEYQSTSSPVASVTPTSSNGHIYCSYPLISAGPFTSGPTQPAFPVDGAGISDAGGPFWLDMGVVPFPPPLGTIMDALAVQLRNELGDSIAGIQVEPRFILSPSPDPVSLDLLTGLQEPGAFGIGVNDVMIDIRARINTADHVAAQDILIGLIDPNGSSSVLQAVMGDPTLGNTVQNSKIEDGPTAMGVFPDASGTAAFLGCTWTVRVIP